MTDAELDKIEQRYAKHDRDCASQQGCCDSVDDVPKLVDEVRRLRESNRLHQETNRHNVERMLPLSWTSEPPSVPGWCWHKYRNGPGPQVLYYSQRDLDREKSLAGYPWPESELEWAGPLLPPDSA